MLLHAHRCTQTTTSLNRCADDDGNVYFKKLVGETGKYANITEAKAAGWGFYMYDTYPDPEIATTTSLDGTEYLLAIPMQIPEDAQPGDTYKFVMPEDNIRRATNKVSGTYIGRCPDGDGSSQIVNSLDYIYLDGERYFDLKGTEITLTVKGAEAQVDYSKLQAKYDEVKDTVVANYNNTEDFVIISFLFRHNSNSSIKAYLHITHICSICKNTAKHPSCIGCRYAFTHG